MAARNLARSIVEGGRSKSSRDIERTLTRVERRRTRATLRMSGEEVEMLPIRIPNARESADKLMPLQRFLRHHVGCPWDEIYSEIRGRFSITTMKGWHLINDHVKGNVAYHVLERRYHQFFVDESGLLRERMREKTRIVRENVPAKSEIKQWMNNRVYRLVGRKMFWCECASQSAVQGVASKKECVNPTCIYEHTWALSTPDTVHPYGRTVRQCLIPRGYRQTHEFSPEDYAFFDRIPFDPL